MEQAGEAVLTAAHILLVGIGGSLGSMARYAVSRYISARFASRFPYATLTVNVVGSFLIGLWLGTGYPERWDDTKLFLEIGFLGAFTTFSTYASDNVQLLQQRRIALLLIYQTASFLVTVAAVAAGWSCSHYYLF